MTVTCRYPCAFYLIRSIVSVIARLMGRMAMISVRRISSGVVPPFYLLPIHEERPEDFRVLCDHVLRLTRILVFDFVLRSLANGSSCSGVLVPRVRLSTLAIWQPRRGQSLDKTVATCVILWHPVSLHLFQNNNNKYNKRG